MITIATTLHECDHQSNEYKALILQTCRHTHTLNTLLNAIIYYYIFLIVKNLSERCSAHFFFLHLYSVKAFNIFPILLSPKRERFVIIVSVVCLFRFHSASHIILIKPIFIHCMLEFMSIHCQTNNKNFGI